MTEQQAKSQEPSILEKERILRANILELGSLLVAYSGGVDSTYLLAVAHSVLGDQALGVTARSVSLSSRELKAAIAQAQAIGARHELVKTYELDDERYQANAPSRCFFCKEALFKQLQPLAKKSEIAHVAVGFNLDDVSDFRPGHASAAKRGILSPLVEVGMTKEDIRERSKALGLPTWDKPAQPCLSSRIAYGVKVTPELLEQIENAEDLLYEHGFTEFRVRYHEDLARIEVPEEDMERLFSLRATLAPALQSFGFTFVTLDLLGFRSGSLNTTLSTTERITYASPS